MAEFNCCHGIPESGHSATCPYDKEFWGPGGVDWSQTFCRTQINFHDSSMALRHGPGSDYAKNFTSQAAVVEAPAKVVKKQKAAVQKSESLF